MMRFQSPPTGELLSVEEAQARVLEEVAIGPVERATLVDAAGRVLRERIVAGHDLPGADNSAMDGFAVRSADLASATAEAPVALRLTGDVPAGALASGPVAEGSTMSIMTGAWLPEGADAVVQVEQTETFADRVLFRRPVASGTNLRRRGEDVRAGEAVLDEGVILGPAEIAMLAAVGRVNALVSRRPDVAIVSTGDELVEPGQTLRPGSLFNSNGALLAALVEQAGGVAIPVGTVRDDRDETIRALERAMQADFILTSGGVSVGAYDYVKEALEAMGAVTKFWRVAMKPGKPFVLSRKDDRLFFGLPGNPASCFVGFHLFVAPALRRALGAASGIVPQPVRVRLLAPLRPAADRRVYYRVAVSVVDGELAARPLATQSSGAIRSMLHANGLAVVEPGDSPKDHVPVLLLALPA